MGSLKRLLYAAGRCLYLDRLITWFRPESHARPRREPVNRRLRIYRGGVEQTVDIVSISGGCLVAVEDGDAGNGLKKKRAFTVPVHMAVDSNHWAKLYYALGGEQLYYEGGEPL